MRPRISVHPRVVIVKMVDPSLKLNRPRIWRLVFVRVCQPAYPVIALLPLKKAKVPEGTLSVVAGSVSNPSEPVVLANER